MRCYGVGWIKCRGGDDGENGILYLHMGEKEKWESNDRIRQWGSRAVGLITIHRILLMASISG
jgi:hypothetical protein